MQVHSLSWEDTLEKEMATHSSILAWKIPQLEEPDGLQFVGLQRVEHKLATRHACIKWEQTAQLISFIKKSFNMKEENKKKMLPLEIYKRNYWLLEKNKVIFFLT